MTSFWALAVARDDLSRTALVAGDVPEIGDGEALLRVDRVGLTGSTSWPAAAPPAPATC